MSPRYPVAQWVKASDQYPECHEFDSCRRLRVYLCSPCACYKMNIDYLLHDRAGVIGKFETSFAVNL